jgi:hypothetical protein
MSQRIKIGLEKVVLLCDVQDVGMQGTTQELVLFVRGKMP